MDAIVSLPPPELPRKPKDLREVAYERAHTLETRLTARTLAQMEKSLDPLIPMLQSLSERISSIVENINVFGSIPASEDVAEIEIREVLHTRSNSVSCIYLVPAKKGVFEAKVTIMRAEYETPEETTAVFECE